MKQITLENSNIHKGNLILVNEEHPIEEKYAANDTALVNIDFWNHNILLDYLAAKELSHLMNELECGNDIVPVKGYQKSSAYADLSKDEEHSTGLAVDLSANVISKVFMSRGFPKKGICQEFRKLASKYGFIERYPKTKENITGVEYQPGHFRYVGYPHSVIMEELDITMEEYLKTIEEYSARQKAFCYRDKENLYEIFSVKADENVSTTVEIADNIPFTVSGNNIDGFVMTLSLKQQRALT
ncbi:D-alanyl-D-alanine carboxypeptidase family protein [Anaerocolumna xylanovorans]|uniref:D-alanyl-D-alanine dipeptidase/carboxypeptidase n=1 Tax=Anaerocolumna xylanovorans DSM 12503 TaxID=1121345 RepID=A0A1M7Y1V9_9FIRM|nr:D-alanyl-D-alanine carboxypeptidase family protein [Anaerocolumna xylanovorans]SHO45810.1 D-alanyl-D-alanine dipeptidase/carboxypeptidase [Anaerocolumna xylanovorans DSM 12503]